MSEPSSFHVFLPPDLPEPYYFLSAAQADKAAKYEALRPYAELLPGWLPHRLVAQALGYDNRGIDAAVAVHQSYAWATEFENVHSFWDFVEPGFDFEGLRWAGSEQLYQALKFGAPGSPEFQQAAPQFAALADPMTAWKLGRAAPASNAFFANRDDAMRLALRLKFGDGGEGGRALRALLLSTGDLPLVSVKADAYWGAGFDGFGANRLGALLVELRAALRDQGDRGGQGGRGGEVAPPTAPVS